MKRTITYRVFIGDRPIEELNEKELREFRDKTVERMGNALNDYFSQHIEEYKKL